MTSHTLAADRPFDTICMVGLGYIGLPTAAVMASRKLNIVGLEVTPHVVDTINKGGIHIVEPHLDGYVKDAVENGFLRATLTPEPADAFMIAVPTPIDGEKKSDLSYVMSAGRAIAPVLKQGDIVILESTSPVGATERLLAALSEARPDLSFPVRGQEGCDVHIAYCPERVLPGKVVEELVSNDRAIGGMTKACTARAMALYALFVEGTLFPTDTRSAELCKLAENAFRDVNIAYANELANVCEGLDMNVWEVIHLANRHPRVNILQPGPGVGGHCIAVDPWFIAEVAPDDTPLIQAARHVNDGRPYRVVDRVKAACAALGKDEKDITVACYGLAFKPDIDDLRESPSLQIAREIADTHAGTVLVVEPNVEAGHDPVKGATLVDMNDAYAKADVHVMLVDHKEFKAAKAPRGAIVDVKGIWKQ